MDGLHDYARTHSTAVGGRRALLQLLRQPIVRILEHSLGVRVDNATIGGLNASIDLSLRLASKGKISKTWCMHLQLPTSSTPS